MFQSGLDGGSLIPADLGDMAIPTGDVSGSSMDFGGGIYFNTENVYLGSRLYIYQNQLLKKTMEI